MSTAEGVPVRHWTLDKRIPIALLVTIAVQTGGVVWWASTISSRVTALESRQEATSDIPGRVIRLETIVPSLSDQLKAINDKLDRLIERRP